MQLSDKIKKFSVEQAIDYRNRNPVKNLPKLLDWADTFCAGKFGGQRRAISSEGDETTTDSRRAISSEGDETTTDSRRSEKEVKRAQRKQKIVCKECKSTVSQSGDGAFPAFPRGDGQGTQSRTGKSVISAAGAAPRDRKINDAVCPASFIFLSAGLSAKYSCPDSLPAYCPLWCALIVASLPRRSSPLQSVIHFSRFYVS